MRHAIAAAPSLRLKSPDSYQDLLNAMRGPVCASKRIFVFMKKTTFKWPLSSEADLHHYLKGLKSRRMLDIATGKGTFIKFITSTLGHYNEIVGIDIDELSLLTAVESLRAVKGIRFERSDAENLPYPDNHFDLVSLSNALHHMSHPELVFNEMRRVLAPGGRLLINEMNYDDADNAQKAHQRYHSFKAKTDHLAGVEHRPVSSMTDIAKTIKEQFPGWRTEFFLFPGETFHKNSPITVKEQLEKIERLVQTCRERRNSVSLLAEAQAIKRMHEKYGVRYPSYMLTVLSR
ncbi:MAG: methyltransferase domain-containing protein [Fibrobacterota bacterium]